MLRGKIFALKTDVIAETKVHFKILDKLFYKNVIEIFGNRWIHFAIIFELNHIKMEKTNFEKYI